MMMRKKYLGMQYGLMIFIALAIMASAFAQSDVKKMVPILIYLLLEEESVRCQESVELGETTNAALTADCSIDELGEIYFTRFYSFSLEQDAEVVIALEPTGAPVNIPHLVLREGSGTDGEELFFGEAESNIWKIKAELEADEFTIEVSSVSEEVLDTFRLSVGQLQR